jgi:integrase/recombinase XerD
MIFPEALQKYMQYLKANDRSAKTLYGYRSDLKKFQSFYESRYNITWCVEDTTTEDIEVFLQVLHAEYGLQPASRNRILNSLRSFYKFLCARDVCRTDPTDPVRSVRQVRRERSYVTDEQFDRIVEAIEHPLIRIATQTLYYTGLRISELVNLSIKDVDLDRGLIHVFGKGLVERDVPIHWRLHPLLVEYRNSSRAKAELWDRFFATPTTGRLSASHYTRELHKAIGHLDMGFKITAHTFRHSFASNLVRKNVHLASIQKLLGHNSVMTTSVYTHVHLSELQAAVNTL